MRYRLHPDNPGYNINDESSKIFGKVISCSAKSFRLCKSIREKRCIFIPIKSKFVYESPCDTYWRCL